MLKQLHPQQILYKLSMQISQLVGSTRNLKNEFLLKATKRNLCIENDEKLSRFEEIQLFANKLLEHLIIIPLWLMAQ